MTLQISLPNFPIIVCHQILFLTSLFVVIFLAGVMLHKDAISTLSGCASGEAQLEDSLEKIKKVLNCQDKEISLLSTEVIYPISTPLNVSTS